MHCMFVFLVDVTETLQLYKISVCNAKAKSAW